MKMITAIWGEEKTGKTTMALTFPKPIRHFDLDVGGYQRAAWRVDTNGIVTVPYPVPLQIEKMMGLQKEGITVRIPKKVVGMKELWQSVIQGFIEAVQDPTVQTVIIDSATQLWSICHRGYLQELQEKQIANGTQDKDLRERLIPLEYSEPNDRMKAVIFTARSFQKNLVLTHYPRDVYGPKLTDRGIEEIRTGEVDIDGFKQTKALVDIAIRTKSTGGKMIGTVTLSGLSKAIEGMEMDNPTYDQLQKLIDFARGTPDAPPAEVAPVEISSVQTDTAQAVATDTLDQAVQAATEFTPSGP